MVGSDPCQWCGIDASLFHDDERTQIPCSADMGSSRIPPCFWRYYSDRIDTETMKLKPETARTIYAGTDVKLVEGPHLYKINGLLSVCCTGWNRLDTSGSSSSFKDVRCVEFWDRAWRSVYYKLWYAGTWDPEAGTWCSRRDSRRWVVLCKFVWKTMEPRKWKFDRPTRLVSACRETAIQKYTGMKKAGLVSRRTWRKSSLWMRRRCNLDRSTGRSFDAWWIWHTKTSWWVEYPRAYHLPRKWVRQGMAGWHWSERIPQQ